MTDYDILASSLVLVGCLAKRQGTIIIIIIIIMQRLVGGVAQW